MCILFGEILPYNLFQVEKYVIGIWSMLLKSDLNSWLNFVLKELGLSFM